MTRFRPALIVLALGTFLPGLPGSTLGQQLPPAFPRDGAKKILENERGIVWDVQLQKGQRAAMHTRTT